jgi:hypothetical protein
VVRSRALHTGTSKIILNVTSTSEEMCFEITRAPLHSEFVIDAVWNVCMAKQTGVYLRNIADNFNDEIKSRHLLFSVVSPKLLLLAAFLSIKVHKYI